MQLYSVSAARPVYGVTTSTFIPSIGSQLRQPAWATDRVQLTTVAKTSAPERSWTPAMKITLMATPVAAGIGIGLARGGAVGGLVGGAIGAALSVVGLWWHMTVGNPFDRYPSGPELPPPPKP